MTNEDELKSRKALYDQLLEHDNKHLERMQVNAKRAGKGIDTGYNLFSRSAKGDLSRFQLKIPKYAITIVCARTGGGKTCWLTNISTRMAMAGATGFFITLEEPDFMIRAKMLACYSRSKNEQFSVQATNTWNALKVISGNGTCAEMKEFNDSIMKRVRIVDANTTVDLKKISSPAIMYQPQFITDLVQYRNQKADRPLDFVVIDFGQLMESEDADNSNSYMRIKAVMQALKNLAGSLGIAVIIGAQLQRSCASVSIWDWEPEMIRDGSDMEQAASLILASGVDKDSKDKINDMALRFLKNRNGPKRVAGMFNISFDCNYIPLEGLEPKDD